MLIDSYTCRLQYEQMYGAVILASLLGIVVFWALRHPRHLRRRPLVRGHPPGRLKPTRSDQHTITARGST